VCIGSSDAKPAARQQFLDSRSIDETTFVSRAPLQSCGNTRDVGFLSSPEAPVLSSLAQQCLRSGAKPK